MILDDGKLLPRIMGDAGGTDHVARPFLADLVLGLVLEEEDGSVTPLPRAALAGHDEEALYAQARRNMAELVPFTFTGTCYGGFGILADGEHEADALCLPFIWDAVASQAKTDLIVSVPARDSLFMAVAADDAQAESMIDLAREVFLHGHEPLTRTLFLFSAETRQFSVFGSL